MNYLGIEKEKLSPVIEKLNDLLSNYHIYYQNLRCHHWYVEGQNFFELHNKFEELYNAAKINIDDIAERILTLRFYPVGRLSEYLERAEIEEQGRIQEDHKMVNQILHSHKILIDNMREVMASSSEVNDEGTIDLVGSMLEEIEKHSWMLDAWMSRINREVVA